MCFAGEKLTDVEVDLIFKLTGTEEDIEGNIKYEGTARLLILHTNVLINRCYILDYFYD